MVAARLKLDAARPRTPEWETDGRLKLLDIRDRRSFAIDLVPAMFFTAACPTAAHSGHQGKSTKPLRASAFGTLRAKRLPTSIMRMRRDGCRRRRLRSPAPAIGRRLMWSPRKFFWLRHHGGLQHTLRFVDQTYVPAWACGKSTARWSSASLRRVSRKDGLHPCAINILTAQDHCC